VKCKEKALFSIQYPFFLYDEPMKMNVVTTKNNLILCLLLAALAAGCGLRLLHIQNESIWWDEYASHAHLDASSFSEFYDLVRTLDPLALPGYLVPEYFWAKWVSPSLFSLRLESIAIGLATLLLLYAFADKYLSRRVALLSVWLLALSPVHIHHSQSIRMYGLLVFLALGVMWSFLGFLERRNLSSILLHGVFSFALCWTHPFAVLVLAGPVTYMLFTRHKQLRLLLIWFLLQGTIFIPQAFYLAKVRFWPQNTTAAWFARPTFTELIADLFFDDIISFHWQLRLGEYAQKLVLFRSASDWLLALAIVFFLIAAFLFAWKKRKETKQQLVLYCILPWLILPPLALFCASWLLRPCMFPRYTVHCLIPLYLLVAAGAGISRNKLLVSFAALVLLAGTGLQWVWTLPGPQRTQWRQTALFLQEQSKREDVVLVEEFLWRDVLQHNARWAAQVVLALPVAAVADQKLLAAEAAFCLSRQGKAESVVWAVIPRDYFDFSPPADFESWLSEAGLSFERFCLSAIRDIYIYKIAAERKSENALSLEECFSLDRSFGGEEREKALTHREIESVGDLALELAVQGSREEACAIFEALMQESSFAKEIYSSVVSALQRDEFFLKRIEAVRWLWKGYGARNNSQTAYAIYCFSKAAQKDSASGLAHLEEALERIPQRDYESAASALTKAQAQPGSYREITKNLLQALNSGKHIFECYEAVKSYREASLAVEQGDTAGAKHLLEESLSLDPALALSQLLLAYIRSVYEEGQRVQEMMEGYAALTGKSITEAYAHLALLQAENFHPDLCKKTLDTLFQADPDTQKIYRSLHKACSDGKNSRQAAASIRAMWNAYEVMAAGDNEAAGDLFGDAARLDSTNTLALLEWGLLLAEKGAYDEALTALISAADADPDYARFLAEVIQALETGQAPEKHIAAVRAYRRGILAQSRGELDAAEKALKEALFMDSTMTEAYTSLTFLLVMQKKYAEAEEILTHYFSVADTPVSGAYGLMSLLHLAAGREGDAAKCAFKALAGDATYTAQFGVFFTALFKDKNKSAVLEEIHRLKGEGINLEALLGDLLDSYFQRP
jgi:Tfp pilus assembly protein PilF